MLRAAKLILISTITISFTLPSIINAEVLNKSFHIFFSLGGMRLTDTDDLNTELENNGYPKVEERTGLFGAGLRYSGESFIFGLQGHSKIGKEKTKDSYKVSYSVGYGLFEFGYNFINTEGLKLYPLLGIGGGGITINIRESDTAGFTETLNNPNRNSRIVHGDMIVDLSLGIEYLVPLIKSGGLILGAQFGYMYPVYDAGWKTGMSIQRRFEQMEDVDGGPDFKFAGPHFQVNLGWAFLL